MKEKVAIIDCGTNTFHLLIVQREETDLEIIERKTALVKIGEGGINARTIVPEAMERALTALLDFKKRIKSNGATHTYAMATSAFRNAKNGEELKAIIKKEIGLDIQIISGEREAELIFHGVSSAIAIGQHPVLVIDIGGGSVEFIIGSKDRILWKRSFELGAQRLLDLFQKNDPISTEELVRLENYLQDKLPELLAALKKYLPKTLIGSSGTFDTLSAIYCARLNIEHDRNQKEIPFDIKGFPKTYQLFITQNRENRLAIPGMIPMRVDMIVVASALIDWILHHHHFERMKVSTYALKEGVLDQVIKHQL